MSLLRELPAPEGHEPFSKPPGVYLIGCVGLAEPEVNFRYGSLHDSHILEPWSASIIHLGLVSF